MFNRTVLAITVVFTIALPSMLCAEKVALLIGVEDYQKRGFSNLRYAEDDMKDLSAELKSQGFTVALILGSESGSKKATAANIRKVIQQSFLPRLQKLKKSDIAIVAVAGHGRHLVVRDGGETHEDHFFCPVDAHNTDHKTWISISQLIADIEAKRGRRQGPTGNHQHLH